MQNEGNFSRKLEKYYIKYFRVAKITFILHFAFCILPFAFQTYLLRKEI